MNKTLKYIFSIALLVSIILNIVTINLLKEQSIIIETIKGDMNIIINSANPINNNISNSKRVDKVEDSNDIMSPSELAEYLKIDIEQVHKLIIQNPSSKVPYLNINGDIRFSKKAIDEYMLKGNKDFK